MIELIFHRRVARDGFNPGICVKSSRRCSPSCVVGSPGVCCRSIFSLGAPLIAGLRLGATTAFSKRSMTLSLWPAGNEQDAPPVPWRRSSIVRESKPSRPAGGRLRCRQFDETRGSGERSKAANGMRLSIRTDGHLFLSRIRPASRIAMAPSPCFKRHGRCSLSWNGCSPMAASQAIGSRKPPSLPSRSSAKALTRLGLPSSLGGGPFSRHRVERFFAWINRNRRLAKDFEATIDSARAFSMPPPSCSLFVASHESRQFGNRL